MDRNLYNLPNAVTACRLLAFPVMWWFAVERMTVPLGLAIVFCLTTDILDGFLARRFGQATSFGAKFDSFADNLLLASSLFWLWRLAPEVAARHELELIGFALLLVAVFAIMAIKFRRNVEIHTYTSKLGVGVMWLYIVYTFLIGHNEILFYAFLVTSYAYLIEDIYLLVTRRTLDEHERGLLAALSRRAKPEP